MSGKDLAFPRIVVLGAGFGGLHIAKALAKKPAQVTLVDRNNYHLFQPLLYQVATSMVSSDEIAYPIRSILRRERNLSFHLGEVQEINLFEKCIVTNSGNLHYDYLVIALGGETNYFGQESVARNSLGLKDLNDAVNIRNHLLRQLELAEHEKNPDKRRAMLTFVVVGGGPTGVECAGAISELARIVLEKDYPKLHIEDVRVILLEAIDKLLANMPTDLGEAATDALKRKHVEVRFKTIVTGYDGAEVSLKDKSPIPAHTLIWAAGVRASALLDTLGLEQDRLGRITVESTLQVPEHPEIFVIGDSANLTGKDGAPLPMLAPVAIQQARAAAKNLLLQSQGKIGKPFVYRDPGVLATIGRNQAVAHLGRWKFRGFLAWLMWVVVHIYQLVGFRNRLAVLIDWAWSYLFYDRAMRLIEPAQMKAPAQELEKRNRRSIIKPV